MRWWKILSSCSMGDFLFSHLLDNCEIMFILYVNEIWSLFPIDLLNSKGVHTFLVEVRKLPLSFNILKPFGSKLKIILEFLSGKRCTFL